MCERCDAVAAELAAIEVDLLELETDIAAGLVPPWARRGLYPHERAAGVNFARIDAAVQARADRVARLLTEHRDRIAADIAEQLRSASTPAELADIVARITDPSRPLSRDVTSYGTSTRRLEQQIADELRGAYGDGLGQMAAELEAQARPAAALDALPVPADVAEQIAQRAASSAQAPARVTVSQLAAEAARSNLYDLALDAAVDRLVGAVSTGGAKGLDTDAGRVPVQQIHARARVDALAAAPQALTYYASELLDRNTCGPCSMVDGVRYASLEDATADYPGGTYIGCLGGERCRGTLVAVWDTEAPATVQDVADVPRPEPPPPPAPATPPADPDAPTSPAGANPDPEFGPDAGPPDPLPDGAPLEVEVDVVDELAAELGIPREDVLQARAQLRDLRTAARAEAAEVQSQARDWFYGGFSPITGKRGGAAGLQLRTPPKKVLTEDRLGRKRWARVDASGGDYDWIDDLEPGELRRLQRRGWFDPEGATPDQLHQSLNYAAGDETQAGSLIELNDAVFEWRRHASLTDAAGAVARGKMPTGSHIVGLEDIAPDLAREGWNLDLIMAPGADNDIDALRHVLTKEAEEVGDLARRELLGNFERRTGSSYAAELGPAPWKMSADSYRLELLDLEHEITVARSLGQTPPAAAVARWHELVPIDDLDEAGAPLDAATLHGTIVELARLAARGGWLP